MVYLVANYLKFTKYNKRNLEQMRFPIKVGVRARQRKTTASSLRNLKTVIVTSLSFGSHFHHLMTNRLLSVSGTQLSTQPERNRFFS